MELIKQSLRLYKSFLQKTKYSIYQSFTTCTLATTIATFMSRTPRKLIFHIGHHKTGSTTIQRALATGSIQVNGQKPLYPGRMAHNYFPRHFNAYAKEKKILNGSAGRPNLEEISRLLKNEDYRYAVISGENFEGAKADVVKKGMLKFMLPHVDEHTVICYVRPHAARVLSSFAEQSKIGIFSGSIAEFHHRSSKKSRFKYVDVLAQWIAEFGDRFIAGPMVRDVLCNGSLLDDFTNYAFPEAEVRVQEIKAANESLSLEDLVFLRCIQGHLGTRVRGIRHNLGWLLGLTLTAKKVGGTSTKLALDRGLAEDIRKHYLADAYELDRTIFESSPVMVRELDQAVDTALPAPQSMQPSDHFSAETLRHFEVIADMLNTMLDNKGEPWPNFLRDRRVNALLSPSSISPERI